MILQEKILFDKQICVLSADCDMNDITGEGSIRHDFSRERIETPCISKGSDLYSYYISMKTSSSCLLFLNRAPQLK